MSDAKQQEKQQQAPPELLEEDDEFEVRPARSAAHRARAAGS